MPKVIGSILSTTKENKFKKKEKEGRKTSWICSCVNCWVKPYPCTVGNKFRLQASQGALITAMKLLCAVSSGGGFVIVLQDKHVIQFKKKILLALSFRVCEGENRIPHNFSGRHQDAESNANLSSASEE